MRAAEHEDWRLDNKKTIKTFLNLISYVSCYVLISRNEGV